jgi:hypothetical protein
MKRILQIENCKLKIANWKKRLALSSLGLCVLCLFAGCPEQATVTVTMKPVAGEATATPGGESPTEAAAAGYGSFAGTIKYEGSPRDLPPLVAAGDPTLKPEDRAVCAAMPVPNETLVVNPNGNGLENAIVFLEKRPGNIKPELATPPTDKVFFDQKGCRFHPHVLVVQIGQPLFVVSDDPIPHNTHTRPKRNPEFNKLIAAIEPDKLNLPASERPGVPCVYKKPESGPISVVCDLHTWMKGYHFPIDHPYWAVTDNEGKFEIKDLPAGKHSFNIWHESAPGDAHLLERKLQITIEVDKPTTKELSYGSARFAAVPHFKKIRSTRQPAPVISFDRLRAGGQIVVTQNKETP